MADEVTYSDRELEHIAAEITKATAPKSTEVEGCSIDMNDDEISKFYILMTALSERYVRKTMDLRVQADLKKRIIDGCFKIGLVARVEWEYTQNPITGFTVVSPDVTIVDRVGGLVWETDQDRKHFDAVHRTIDEITPDKDFTVKLMD